MSSKPIQDLIAVATGQRPADIVLKYGRIFNVFTGTFSEGDVAIVGGYIAGIGTYSGRQEYDCSGLYLTPGFIDSHVHLESSMVSPGEFARAVMPWGTTTVIADPHEIANVAGREGIRYILDAAGNIPLDIYVMLPSCVPATGLETAGAQLTASDLAEFINHPRVLGLGELMNYLGVLQCKEDVLDKIKLSGNKPVDGHGPGLYGKTLTGYIAAGVNSDHECTTADEAAERLAQGMYIMLREGSAAKNLLDLLPVVNTYTARRCLFVTDDRHPEDLSELGHINHMVRMAVDAGVDLALAIQMATINAAQYFRLNELGAVAPGYRADILAFRDLENWRPHMVFKDGKIAAREGRPLFARCPIAAAGIRNTVHLGEVDPAKLRIPAPSSQALVIELIPHQIVSRKRVMTVPVENGAFVASPEEDILKVAVFERHRGSGNVGVGLLHGFGLREGAIASTIAHDSHNVVVAGMNDDDMLLAVEEVKRMQGGLAITSRGRVLGTLALPLAGLMAEDDIFTVRTQLKKMLDIAYAQGVKPEHDPFLTLAFLCLPVIPELKITDQGLVDVNSCSIIPVSG